MSEDRKQLADAFAALSRAAADVCRALGGNPGAALGAQRIEVGKTASEADLDGPRGNPVVKKTPKNWKGRSVDNRKLSDCSLAFLDFYADHMDWCALNPLEGKEKYAKYNALDGARARGWAARLRAAGKPEGDGEMNGAARDDAPPAAPPMPGMPPSSGEDDFT